MNYIFILFYFIPLPVVWYAWDKKKKKGDKASTLRFYGVCFVTLLFFITGTLMLFGE